MDEITSLRRLGFTEYEARVYMALARSNVCTATQVSRESKVPRNKVYEALSSLEEKNKIICVPLSPREYKIQEPGSLKNDVELLNDSITNIIRIASAPRASGYLDLFWVIKGQKNIHEKLAFQNQKSEKEVLSCVRLTKILYKNIRIMKQTVDRGVKVKFLCDFRSENKRIYREWLKTGAEIRVFNKEKFGPLVPRMHVFDRSITILTIGQPEIKDREEYISICADSKAFSEMFRNHFLNMWKHSKPIKEFI